MEFKRKPVTDIGIDQTLDKVDSAKIKKAIDWVLNKEASARLKVFVETCLRCGMCTTSCHHYLSHENDPTYAPAAKVKQTVWDILSKKGNVTKEDIKKYARIAFTECNLCRRCVQFCPFGIDIAYLISLIRRICCLIGAVPQYIQDQALSHMQTTNMLWFRQDEWLDTIQWLEDELRGEIKNARIPLGKKDAEILYLAHGLEAKYMTGLLTNMAKIMNVARLDWTMPDMDGWDYTNKAFYAHDFETLGKVVRTHYEVASKLNVKRIVMGECGHAFRTGVYEGVRYLGWKEPPIPYIHGVQFFYELLKEGRITIAHKIKEPVTIQDPCNIVRYRGMGKMLRDIVKQICENVIEMTPKEDHNYCCSAGGGMIDAGPVWKSARIEGGKVKAEQIKDTGAKIVIAPCHTCHKGIEDLNDFYKLDVHVKFLTDLIAETMEIPEEMRP
ncbi:MULTISPECIES: (Fe-S)-binding protein [Thermodesulfovibrio]|jgi:Fe-S oxidoreductase|uniref:(Fe-S)-binding protein n=1 Tax=Thermodesulfovibrio TaxID=28261 RepID=UPI002610E6A8|nr:(Fe-S)-binding protein [Thermodesulfovibrio sp.]